MSAGIARVAKQLGLLEGSRTSVVHALEHDHRAMLYLAGVSESEVRKYQRTRSQIASSEVVMHLDRADLNPSDFSFFFPKTSPLPAIEQVARLVGSDLVVIGSSRFPELKRWFVGSVSNDALRRLENDVLLVSPAAARRARKQAPTSATPRSMSRLQQSLEGRSTAIELASTGRNH
jgi:nucleotide-binding universal stress UspA family protein